MGIKPNTLAPFYWCEPHWRDSDLTENILTHSQTNGYHAIWSLGTFDWLFGLEIWKEEQDEERGKMRKEREDTIKSLNGQVWDIYTHLHLTQKWDG